MPLSPALLPIGSKWHPVHRIGDWEYHPSQEFAYPLALPYAVRDRHAYLLGTTGAGKSTLMRHMILGDIARGHGVTLITPNNQDNFKIMAHIAPEHHSRVIYFNPEDTERPVAYNPLTLHPGENIHTKVSQLIEIFRNALREFSPQQDALLKNALYALLKRPHSTLVDLLDLIDPDTQDRHATLLASADEEPRNFFRTKYPSIARVSALPILTRFSDVRLVRPFQLALCQSEGTLNLFNVLTNRNVLLLNLSPALGPGNAAVLGQFMLAAFQQALELRFALHDRERVPHYLYIDELELFAPENTTTLQRLLQLARGLNLGITIVHHGLWQLTPDVLREALALTNTKVVFRCDEGDAPKLARYLKVDPDDLATLPRFHACVRIDTTTNFIATFPERRGHPEYQAAITKASRKHHGRPPTLATTDQPAYNEGEQPKPKPKPPEQWLE